MKKKVKWIAVIAIVVIIIGYSIYSSSKPLDIELVDVQPQTVSQEFKEEGIVAAATEMPVYSQVNGKLNAVNIKVGDQVKAGDTLFTIDTKDIEYQMQQLKGQLQSVQGQITQSNRSPYAAQIEQQQLVIQETKRQLEVANDNYDKVNKLYISGAATKQDADNALNAAKQLENALAQQEQALNLINEQANPLPGTSEYYQGQLKSINAQICQLENQKTNSAIKAPINGVVKELSVKGGEIVTSQAPLLTLASQNAFEVNTYLLTEDVISINESMKVKLIQKRKDKDYEFNGIVKAIAPSAEEKISALGLSQQKVKVTIALDNSAPELRSGYSLDVVFTTLEQQNKLAVPKVVIFPYQDSDALWVVRDGAAAIQKVKTGMETDELVVIEKGLKAGDKVIRNAQQEGLKVGKRVK